MSEFDKKSHKIEWIQVKFLSVVWIEAQRPKRESWVKEIADNLDPDKFGVLSVTKPNGSGIYHIIDGQNRKAALELKYGPDEMAPCQVFDAVDPARAAKLFDGLNNTRAVSTVERFLVRVTAEERDEVAVHKIVKDAGYRISNGGKDSPKVVSCVAAMMDVYRKFGAETLTNTLKIVQATWGMDKNAVTAPIARGYGEFLIEHGSKVNWGRLKDAVAKKFTPGRFIGAVKSSREMEGGTSADAVKRLLVATYNRGSGISAAQRLRHRNEGAEGGE